MTLYSHIFGIQQTRCSSLPCPSLAAQQAVFELSGSELNPMQHVLLLAQLLPAVCDQILAVDQLASVHLDSWNHWQVRGLPCCIWDVHAFGVVLAAQRVEVQAPGGER